MAARFATDRSRGRGFRRWREWNASYTEYRRNVYEQVGKRLRRRVARHAIKEFLKTVAAGSVPHPKQYTRVLMPRNL